MSAMSASWSRGIREQPPLNYPIRLGPSISGESPCKLIKYRLLLSEDLISTRHIRPIQIMTSLPMSKLLDSTAARPTIALSQVTSIPSRASLSRSNSYDRDRQRLRRKRQWQRRRDSNASATGSSGHCDSGVEDQVHMIETEEPSEIYDLVCDPWSRREQKTNSINRLTKHPSQCSVEATLLSSSSLIPSNWRLWAFGGEPGWHLIYRDSNHLSTYL